MVAGSKSNAMLEPRIEKLTLNVGIGEGGEKLEKAIKVVEKLVGTKVMKTSTIKRIPDFGVRPGTVIGCKTTIRGEKAVEFLKRAFEAIGNKLREEQFDDTGNFSFGIKEHIDVPGVKYDPTLGVIGMDICVTVERRGYRVKKRRLKQTGVGRHHRLKAEDSIDFIRKKFGIAIESAASKASREEA